MFRTRVGVSNRRLGAHRRDPESTKGRGRSRNVGEISGARGSAGPKEFFPVGKAVMNSRRATPIARAADGPLFDQTRPDMKGACNDEGQTGW